MKPNPDPARAASAPASREHVIRICEDCYNLAGEMCHTPECVFCRRTMDEVGEALDLLLIRPVIDGERLDLNPPDHAFTPAQLTDDRIRELWRRVRGPHAEITGPIIRFAHCIAEFAAPAGTPRAAREGDGQEEQHIKFRRALDNCYIMARREVARLSRQNPPHDPVTLERWQHVVRFCEEADCKSNILRRSLPTEMTEGSAPALPADVGALVEEIQRRTCLSQFDPCDTWKPEKRCPICLAKALCAALDALQQQLTWEEKTGDRSIDALTDAGISLRNRLAAADARAAQVERERDEAIQEYGMASGFWGRMAARAVMARRKAEAERDALLHRVETLEQERDALIVLAYTDPRTQNRSWRDAHRDAHAGNVSLTARVETLEGLLVEVHRDWLSALYMAGLYASNGRPPFEQEHRSKLNERLIAASPAPPAPQPTAADQEPQP